MNRTKAALVGLALLATTLSAGCVTAQKNYATTDVEFYWNTSPNQINTKYFPLIQLPFDNYKANKQ